MFFRTGKDIPQFSSNHHVQLLPGYVIVPACVCTSHMLLVFFCCWLLTNYLQNPPNIFCITQVSQTRISWYCSHNLLCDF